MKQFTLLASLSLLHAALWAGQAPGAAQPVEADLGLIWSGLPLNQDMKLHCSFDKDNGGVADTAQGFPRPGGFGMQDVPDGVEGGAIQVAERGGYLHYIGKQNVNFQSSTVAFAFRHAGKRKDLPCVLFGIKGDYRIGMRLNEDSVELYVASALHPYEQWDSLQLACDGRKLLDGQWHRFVISWDQKNNWGFVAVDDEQTQGSLEMPFAHHVPIAIFLAGGSLAKGDLPSISVPGVTLDEFTIWQGRADTLAPAEDSSVASNMLATQAKAASRKALDTTLQLQHYGGWERIYTWPTLIGSPAQGRDYLTTPNTISNDKGEATSRVGTQLLCAYQVLQDDTYLYPAIETGQALVAAQSEEGYWVHSYVGTPHGLVINQFDTPTLQGDYPEVKLQDSVQAHPIEFLVTLADLTGDDTYLKAAIKGGEFVYRAQNPNGSWSHHWDTERECGSTVRGLPRGGEINDLAMNDAIDVMHLMYILTGEERFAEAMDRGGQWLLDADTGGKTVGWAQQYDEHNKPTTARAFEPASWSRTATLDAARLLASLNQQRPRDGRYLRKLEELQRWAHDNVDENGAIYEYLEPETGRPIRMWQDNIYYLDDPASVKFLQENTPNSTRTLSPAPFIDKIDQYVEMAQTGFDEQAYISWLPGRIKEELKTQNPECGRWIRPVFSNFNGSVGAAFSIQSNPVDRMLQYIDLQRQHDEHPDQPPVLFGKNPIDQAMLAAKRLRQKQENSAE